MSAIQNITVIGSTGMIGRPVTRELVKAGFTVTCLVRDEAKARTLLPPNVRLVKGDLHDAASVAEALKGADAVYLTVKVRDDERPTEWHAEREGLTILLDACRAAGVKRLGYLNSLLQDHEGVNGYHFWVFALKNEARARLKTSGIPYTIFNPSLIMETYTGGLIRGGAVGLVGRSDVKLYPVAGADYGRQVAAAFRLEAAANREYAIQGPEAFTQHAAAEVFAKHYVGAQRKNGQPLTVSTAPPVLFRVLGLFVRPLHYVSHITTALLGYRERFQSDDTWRELGRPQLTLAQWAAQQP